MVTSELPKIVMERAPSLVLALALAHSLALASESIDLLSYTSYARLVSSGVSDRLGDAEARCDFNGDGIDDVVVTAYTADGISGQREGCGEAYVVFGRMGSWSGTQQILSAASVRIIGQDPFDSFGTSVACADVNGDGFDDAVIGAQTADSLGNSRFNAGEIRLVFGRANPPSVIDLAVDTAPVIYGYVVNGYLGDYTMVASGDINGDSIDDIICSHPAGSGPLGTQNVGQTYVIFGRASWPAELDLPSAANVIIYGERAGAGFGTSMIVAEFGLGDAISELVVGARVGDGPGAIRQDCGDVFVFQGRTVWPPSIDLSLVTSDLRLYGADTFDGLGRTQGLELGDLDRDGTAELWLSTILGDGAMNNMTSAGEVRLFEVVPGRPSVVDIRNWTDWALFGGKAQDYSGVAPQSGDYNGDGTSDLACSAHHADGPDEQRFSAGEILVFYGPRTFPYTGEEPNSTKDLLIYGAANSDSLNQKLAADLNMDGIDELIGSTRTSDVVVPAAMVVISHVDSDGDGVLQLDDNCPLVPNLSQADADFDRIGDACDGDYDGDGLADGLDCKPNRASAGQPPEVAGIRYESGSKARIVWNPAAFAETYDISRGALELLPQQNYGACIDSADPNLADTQFDDPAIPPAATGWFYLVRGRDSECPAVGSWGAASSGTERVNLNPSACP